MFKKIDWEIDQKAANALMLTGLASLLFQGNFWQIMLGIILFIAAILIIKQR
jgi:hypothetical protein